MDTKNIAMTDEAIIPTTIAEVPFMYDNLARQLNVRRDVRSGGLRVVEGGLACGQRRLVRSTHRSASSRRGGVAEAILAVVVVALCVLALLAWALDGERAYAAATSDATFESISVENGASLWSISAAHPVDGLSTEDVISLITERNGLSGTVLQPGQTILVPVSR
ncbi:MAG: LysM peptidoglycan-binding domain-containing protein [Coriobacteriia bacterium]|nr:LysM peptidoglycan-binding domain-containing protein [Coriobacteriia bacterium]MBS5478482.1 LysM peptidoglycan-binding domain-containing protein [Coriobacteriia bacterium]